MWGSLRGRDWVRLVLIVCFVVPLRWVLGLMTGR